MQAKKIIALIVSIIVVLGIVGIIWYVNNNSSNTNNNIHAQNTSNEQGEKEMVQTDDGLLLIEGGSFEMGSPENEAQRNEDETQHTVTVSDFYIGKYEVTQKEYQEVTGQNPSNFKGEDLPVENVTWYDAINYCNQLSERQGLEPVYTIDGTNITWDKQKNGYRLPTEAEWEYAGRAGTTTVFNTETSIGADEANFYGHYPYLIEENYFSQGNLETKPGEYRQETTKVGTFSPNKWGLYDIHGNVREWCFDYYGAYDLENTNNPSGPTEGSLRVNRGGSWNDYAKHMRSAYRTSFEPDQAMSNTGFRIVRNGENSEITGIAENTNKTINQAQYNKDRTLIVYFSWGGNTQNAAETIGEQTGIQVVGLELVNPYSSSYNTVLDEAQRDLNAGTRPELKTKIDNMEQYDTIILGYPNWWATVPMPIVTFLESYDFSGKTILPFCSHGGGEFGQSITDISKYAPNSRIGEGLSIHYSGGSTLGSDISNWLSKNGISKE